MRRMVHIQDHSVSASQLARPTVPLVEEVLEVYALSAKKRTEPVQQQAANNQLVLILVGSKSVTYSGKSYYS